MAPSLLAAAPAACIPRPTPRIVPLVLALLEALVRRVALTVLRLLYLGITFYP